MPFLLRRQAGCMQDYFMVVGEGLNHRRQEIHTSVVLYSDTEKVSGQPRKFPPKPTIQYIVCPVFKLPDNITALVSQSMVLFVLKLLISARQILFIESTKFKLALYLFGLSMISPAYNFVM